ncbi:MAG: RecQ family zinc-binding domain-containing protein [Bryobacteraceae bacterium]|nr:RecQ family zinc-binding domain-containing protein [Bryobacteraceae bacterium]
MTKAAKAAAEKQRKRKEFEASRIEKMQNYAELSSCHREYFLGYFGDGEMSECSNCDNCPEERAETPRAFALHSRVTHKVLGRGVVERYQGGNTVVHFDDGGLTTLSLKAVKESNLLMPLA